MLATYSQRRRSSEPYTLLVPAHISRLVVDLSTWPVLSQVDGSNLPFGGERKCLKRDLPEQPQNIERKPATGMRQKS